MGRRGVIRNGGFIPVSGCVPAGMSVMPRGGIGGRVCGLWLLSGLCVLTGGVPGCGRPAGPLFEVVSPPVVWPRGPDQPRIRWVGSLSGSGDLRAARSGVEVFKAALRGPRPPILFSRPHGVALGPGGLLAVADGSAVHVLDLTSRRHVRVAGWSEERWGMPLCVSWVGGDLFVTDARRHEVVVLDSAGQYLRRFGGETLVRPVGLAYVPSRRQVYVVDGGAHCIRVFDVSGSAVETIGERGTAAGAFNYPSHIAHRDGRLAVSDSGNFRVQLLDLSGACVGVIGQKGDGAGDFSLPKGVAFDGEGHVYVVDAHFENVQVFDTSGRLLLAFGEEGNGRGAFSLPAGVAIDEGNRVWVADSGNRRVCVFDYVRAS